MNFLDVLRALTRRWRIVVPGAVIAIVAAIGVWMVSSPEYERSASQLLLPGEGVLPSGATNQFLYLGGLAPVADVLTRTVSADDVVRDYRESGATVVIGRDASVSGPMVLLKVTAKSDAAAAEMIDSITALSDRTLETLQAEQDIPVSDRVQITTISTDSVSTVSQRPRLIPTIGAGLGILLLTVVIASIVDGLATRQRRRATDEGDDVDASSTPTPDDEVAVSDAQSPDDADAGDRADQDDDVPEAPLPGEMRPSVSARATAEEAADSGADDARDDDAAAADESDTPPPVDPGPESTPAPTAAARPRPRRGAPKSASSAVVSAGAHSANEAAQASSG